MIWLMLTLCVMTKFVREHNTVQLLQEACLFHRIGHRHAQQLKLLSETTLIKQTPTMPHTCMNRVVRYDNHSAAAFLVALGSLMAKFAGDITPWLQMTYSARAPEAAIWEAARTALQEGPSALSCLVIMTRVCG